MVMRYQSMYSNTSQMKTWWWRFTWCFIRYQGSSIVPKWTSSVGFWLQELFMSLIASSAGIFFEHPRICSRNFPKRGGDGASQRERRGGGKREEIFFLPSPSPLSFFRPRTYRKGYYFYSPQSSTIMKSKMAATTIFWTRTRFRPTKIRLHSCRLWVWELASFLSLWPSRPISIKNNNNYWTRLNKNIVICQ